MAATNLQKYVGTPEDQADFTNAYLHAWQGGGLRTLAQGIPPVADSADKGDWRNWVPGILSTGAGWIGHTLGAIGTGLLKSGEYDVNGQPILDEQGQQIKMPTVTVPGTETADKMKANSIAATMNLVPHVEPKTEKAKMGQDIGMGLAEGLTTAIPGVGLPKFVGEVLGTAIPTATAGNVAVSSGVGGTLGAFDRTPGAEGKFTPLDDTAQQPPPTQPATKAATALPPGWEAPGQPATQAAVQTQQTVLPEGWSAPVAPAALPEGWEAPPKPGVRPSFQGLSPENDSGITGWQYALGGAAAAVGLWAAAKHGPAVLNTISDSMRGVGRDVAAANAELASGIPRASTDKPFEMPLPNDAGGATRRWARTNLNPNAVLNEYSKSPIVSATPAEVDARIAANEAINNPANAQRAMEHTFRTGVEQGTGHVFPKIVDYKQAVDALNPGQQEMFHHGAWYSNELNIRNQKIVEAANKGVAWTPQTDGNFRVGFRDMSTEDMRHAVNLAKSDPEVAAVLTQNKAIQLALVDSNELRGGITKAQADYARKWYSDFMPTMGADGSYYNSWDGKLRDIASGSDTAPMPAYQAMINHFDRSLRDMQMNDLRRSIILHQNNIQAIDPTAAKVVTERLTPPVPGQQQKPAGSGLNRTITIGTAGGERHFDVHNTAFWQSLGGGPQRMVVSGGFANAIRKTYQAMTTGLPAAAFGHPFALKNALRDSMLIPMQAKEGLWRGEFDRALNRRTLFDPTFPIMSGATGMKDATTVLAKHTADVFSNRNTPASKGLRGLVGDAKADALIGWMRAQVENSNLAYREARTVGGGGGRVPLTTTGLVTDAAGTYRDPTAHTVAPMLGRPNFGRIPDSVPLPSYLRGPADAVTRGTVTSTLRLNSLAHDLYNVISDAPHSYLHDVNIGNPKFNSRTLADAVQQVTGNPGTHGAGRFTSGVARNVPFYNAGLQAFGKSLAAYRDRPFLTGTTVATVLASLAMAEHLSALISGKKHVDYLENQLSNTTQARNATIFHGPGSDENDNTPIPIPNEVQHIWPFFSAFFGHLVGTWDAHKDDDGLSRIIHTLAGPFQQHISTDTLRQEASGVANALPPTDIPPGIASVVAGLTGQQPRNILETVLHNAIDGKPLFSGLTSGGGVQHKVPGQEGTDGVMLRSDSGTLKAIVNTLGAGFGAAWDLTHNIGQRIHDDPTWAWATHGLWEDYKQQWKDNTPLGGGVVWKHTMPQSTYGPLEERTSQIWNVVNKTASAAADLRTQGFNKATHGVPLTMTGETPVPKDPQMKGVYLSMSTAAKEINRVIMPRENQIRAQIDNVKTGGFMPDEERRLQNKLSAELYEVTARKHQMLLDLSARLSVQLGGRHVDLGHVNWDKGVDQWHY